CRAIHRNPRNQAYTSGSRNEGRVSRGVEGRVTWVECRGSDVRGSHRLKPYNLTRIKRLNIYSQFPSFVGAPCTNFYVYHLSEDPVYRLGSFSQASLAFHFRSPFQEADCFFPRSRI